ncbi:hypothetical protein C0J52_20121 [Blattella germanica]|nr:hypothetical protein C0J52_20121 [Blattella germanica]
MLIINKMEWNNDLCIDLIEAYREQTTLWDPKHPSHYVKSEKLQAWTILANKFNTDILAVKNKMCNLLGSFRREKSKERRSMLASGNGKKAYKSKWFAYESMLFLQTRDDGRSDLLDMENVSTVLKCCLLL